MYILYAASICICTYILYATSICIYKRPMMSQNIKPKYITSLLSKQLMKGSVNRNITSLGITIFFFTFWYVQQEMSCCFVVYVEQQATPTIIETYPSHSAPAPLQSVVFLYVSVVYLLFRSYSVLLSQCICFSISIENMGINGCMTEWLNIK
jgi:hypothetical protein